MSNKQKVEKKTDKKKSTLATNQYFDNWQAPHKDELTTINVTLCGKELDVYSAEGVFSANFLDKATAILLKKAPSLPEEGNFLDLGCGWGAISLTMAMLRNGANIYATDISERALYLTKLNAEKWGLTNVKTGLPEDIKQQVLDNGGIDIIWSNPPIRIGKKALHEMMDLWLPLLKKDGKAIMVMNKNLGADTFAKNMQDKGYKVEKLASKNGFRILQIMH